MDEHQASLDMIVSDTLDGRSIVLTDSVEGLGQYVVADGDQLDVDALQVPSGIVDLIKEDR